MSKEDASLIGYLDITRFRLSCVLPLVWENLSESYCMHKTFRIEVHFFAISAHAAGISCAHPGYP